MSRHDEDGPVYYREIQKHAYLKRIPNDTSSSKLRPLVQKKQPIKPMWTLFCVHNGRTPYLEQYPEADCPSTLSHKPVWRASLARTKHVSGSVRPHCGTEHDFLLATADGPVAMRAPDWETMQDWVSTLRSKLVELQILGRGENVYCPAPAPPPPRALSRDPTSPLPPPPQVPPDRVPGIEMTPQASATRTIATTNLQNVLDHSINESQTETIHTIQTTIPSTTNSNSQPSNVASASSVSVASSSVTYHNSDASSPIVTYTNSVVHPSTVTSTSKLNETNENLVNMYPTSLNDLSEANNPCSLTNTEIDISEWDSTLNLSSIPTTSTEIRSKKRLTKICGQNICLDDSILKRRRDETDSDDEFFATIDRFRNSVEKEGSVDRFIVNSNDDIKPESVSDMVTVDDSAGTGFTQRLVVTSEVKKTGSSSSLGKDDLERNHQATNITVIQVSNKAAPHTAIPILGPETDIFNFDFKQQLTVTSVPSENRENFVNIVHTDDTKESGYGTVFSTANDDSTYGHISLTTTVNLPGPSTDVRSLNGNSDSTLANDRSTDVRLESDRSIDGRLTNDSSSDVGLGNDRSINGRFANDSSTDVRLTSDRSTDVRATDEGIYERLCCASSHTNVIVNKLQPSEKSRKSSLPNLDRQNSSESNYEYLFPTTSNAANTMNVTGRNTTNINCNSESSRTQNGNSESAIRSQNCNAESTIRSSNASQIPRSFRTNEGVSSVSVGQRSIASNASALRRNVERSHSQNTYDSTRLRDRLVRRDNNSSKKNGKSDKPEQAQTQHKPIWKRGLTELSLLSRLRGIGQAKRQESPTRADSDRNVTSPVKVVHRPRGEARGDSSRRRSNSLSNGRAPSQANTQIVSLFRSQAAALRTEQAIGAASVARVPSHQPPILAEYMGRLWVSSWGASGGWHGGRAGDRVYSLRGARPRDAAHAQQLINMTPAPLDILFHRVPLGKIYILTKERRDETIGIKLDWECCITSIEPNSPASRAGIAAGNNAVTQVNHKQLTLTKGGEEEMNRIASCGKEVSVIVQPAALVRKLRASLKSHKGILGLR